jgi:hypothetical protein
MGNYARDLRTGCRPNWPLKIAVFTKDTDPCSGENTTILTKINLSEPDAALFETPPGHTIVDDKEGFR